ncbi:hypothetical protein V491_08505, partial [Pseudogymnoascus sp. VKM F-3775]
INTQEEKTTTHEREGQTERRMERERVNQPPTEQRTPPNMKQQLGNQSKLNGHRTVGDREGGRVEIPGQQTDQAGLPNCGRVGVRGVPETVEHASSINTARIAHRSKQHVLPGKRLDQPLLCDT